MVRGGQRVVRLVLGLERKWGDLVVHRLGWLNGEPAIMTTHDGRLVFTTSVDTDGERLINFYRVLNPEKLRSAGGSST
jgi:RNA polymerase sigma-70 factor (ECF subfamily)